MSNNIDEKKEAPADSSDSQNEINTLKFALNEANDKYLRAIAELDNTRKRFEKIQTDFLKFAVSDFAKELIPVIDIFNKALYSVNSLSIEDSIMKNFILGIQMTHKELEKSLNKFGVTSINPIGEKFDHNYHETLFSKEDPSQENGIIFEVVEIGYKIHDRLLRSAKVGIIKNL